MSSRNRILQRLRQYRSDSPPAETIPVSDTAGIVTPENREQSFVQAMQAAHGEILVTSPTAWKQDLFEHMQRHGISNLMVSTQSRFADLLEQRPPSQTSGQHGDGVRIVPFEQKFESHKQALFHDIAAGFSVAESGIAETGTLIVRTGAADPRTLSLIPPVNYVWLDATTLYANLTEALADPKLLPLPTNLLLISGPSKTADIQQTLAYGAHGPKRLIVLLVKS